MEPIVALITAAIGLFAAYYLGYRIGEADGFEDGMDAAIKVYEEEYGESAQKMFGEE